MIWQRLARPGRPAAGSSGTRSSGGGGRRWSWLSEKARIIWIFSPAAASCSAVRQSPSMDLFALGSPPLFGNWGSDGESRGGPRGPGRPAKSPLIWPCGSSSSEGRGGPRTRPPASAWSRPTRWCSPESMPSGASTLHVPRRRARSEPRAILEQSFVLGGWLTDPQVGVGPSLPASYSSSGTASLRQACNTGSTIRQVSTA
jgi:hypothetical protein